jgi:hypothetical protein
MSDTPRWLQGLCAACIAGYGWLLRHYLGWEYWAAFGAAIAGAALTGFAVMGIRDTWPLAVPYDLSERVDELRAQGWRTARVHPWWRCDSKRPHVHMVNLKAPKAVRSARHRVIREDTAITPLRLE